MTSPARVRLLVAAAALGVALAACGDDDVGDPIPGGKAAELESRLDAVRANFDQEACDEAAKAVAEARAIADTLDDDGVGSDVQDALGDGVDNLGSLVSGDCEEEEVETTPETTPEPTITETTPEPTITETTPEPEPEPTTPVPAPEPQPDEDDGGSQFDPGGAEVPPGQFKKGDG